MTKEEIAKQFEAIKKQRGNANKPAPKLVFTDPLYHKARVLEGAGMVSADKPLPSASLVEKAKMHAKKLTGKMPSKKSIGAVATGLATGYLGAKAIKKEAQAVSGRILMEHNDIQKEAFMGAAKAMAQAAMKKMDKGVRAVGKKVGKGGKAMANKASKGSMAGKMDMRTKKMQRIVGGSTVAGGGLAAKSMMGGDEEKTANKKEVMKNLEAGHSPMKAVQAAYPDWSEKLVKTYVAEMGLEKKASQQAAGVGAAIGGPIGAAIGADKGKRFQSAGGSFLGGTMGSMAGLGVAKALKMKNPMAAMSTVVGTGAAGHYLGATKAHGKDDKKKMKKKAEAVMDKIAKDPRPEPGYFATQMAGTRAMRRGHTGMRQAIAKDELIGARMSQGLKRMFQGIGIGGGAGAAGGVVTSVLSKGKLKPGVGAGVGGSVGAVTGALIGDGVGSYEADRDFLASKGIKMKALGFKRPELTDEAKKKYLSTKYQGGGFDVTKKK